jgi:xanthine dehydrogenase accessory factor
MSLFAEMARLAERGACFVVATVVSTAGSSPQKAGAKVLVVEDGRLFGTVGGGAIERQVIEAARELLGDRAASTRLFDANLTRDLGMACGGRMTVFLEKVDRPERLFLFGAGHVAQALSSIARAAGFRVAVADARPEWLSEERFPGAERALGDPRTFAREAALDGAAACVMTHDHGLDEELAEALLGRKLRYLGVIGSARKGERLRSRLLERGFSAEAVGRVRTPMGVPIGAQSPAEIAVSIAAELIALRRGASSPVAGGASGGAGGE